MDTNNQTTTKIPTIRTYAKDLASNRKAQGLPQEVVKPVTEKETPVIVKTPVRKEPLIKAMPATSTKTKTTHSPHTTPLPPLSSLTHKKHPTHKLSNQEISSTEFIVDNEDAASATIITDTKKDRFKLGSAIFSSISDWFKSIQLSRQAKKTPKYTVPETSRRKGVIQKATSKTGKLETSDFSLIHERIIKRKEEAEKPKPTTNWSANTEPGFLLLESPEASPITNVKLVSRKSYRTSPQEIFLTKNKPELPKPTIPKVTVETVPKIEAIPVIKPVAVETPVNVPKEVPIKDRYQEYGPIDEDVVGEEDVLINQAPKIENEKYEAKLPTYIRLLLINTNTLALGVSGLILAIIIIGSYFYFVVTDQGEISLNLSAVPEVSIINTPLTFISAPTNEKVDLISALTKVKDQSNGELIQAAFIYNNSVNTLIPPYQLLSFFDISLEQNFLKTISHLRFGYTKDRQPYLVMKITGDVTAKGGLFNWEKNIYQDLALIFNIDISQTKLKPKFIDGSLQGVDVRVLLNEDGAELLVYGLANDKVIIATNSINFSEILDLTK